MKTAVLGATGYIGRSLWEAYRHRYPDCLGTSQCGGGGLVPFDAIHSDLSALRLEETGHRALIIATAKPLIGYCEAHKAASRRVNVEATLDIVRQISRTDLQVIWFSSDYVFDGCSGAYSDDAPTSPCTEYGRQKAEVERILPSLTDNYVIVRLSKIYGSARGDKTLLDEIATALVTGGTVRAAADQYFSPTHIDDVVAAVQALQRAGLGGLFNVSNSQDWSRYEIAMALAEQLGVGGTRVQKIRLHDLPGMAGRPLDTTLRSDRLQRELRFPFTPLESSISRVAAQWRNP